jgi:selenocysteine lyase/cysteine desulfurase
MKPKYLDYVRAQILGNDLVLATPFGLRNLFYADYTASGRGLPSDKRGTPVVFIGPYEHHTNELMWREALAEVVVVRLSGRGELDLQDLEEKVAAPRFSGRVKFGSFSAGSNITGLKTPVYEVARICHRHDVAVFLILPPSLPMPRSM